MASEKNKLVCLGDSIGTNYKLKVRANTFSDLLGRRLGLEVCNYSMPAITVGEMFNNLKTNEKMIQDVKDAKIVLIVIGTNNLLRDTMLIIVEAVGISKGMRMVNEMVDTIRNNPAVTLKMIAAMNSKKLKDAANKNVNNFKRDIIPLIDRIKELNSEAIIMAPTLYTMADVGHSLVYKAFSKPINAYFDETNRFIRNELPDKDVIVLELAEAFRKYDGDRDLSNLKENDFHLSDFGHLFTYYQMYDHLIEKYPDLACEEGADVIQERKLRKTWKKEDGDYGRSKYSSAVREIVEKNSYNEIKDYDENKQFVVMGVSPMEVYDIGREIEKEILNDKVQIPIPFSSYIRPTYFIDFLEGKLKSNIQERLDTIPHYTSAEEKAKAMENESETMNEIREAIYFCLKDDMIMLDENTTLLGTLDLDYFTWGGIINRFETVFKKSFDSILIPDPESVTLKQIAEVIEDTSKN